MDGLHLEILFIVQCGQVAPLGTAVLQARKFIGQFRLECVEAACPCGDAARNTGCAPAERRDLRTRSEEHTSELQSLMRISYAVFCLNKKNNTRKNNIRYDDHTAPIN